MQYELRQIYVIFVITNTYYMKPIYGFPNYYVTDKGEVYSSHKKSYLKQLKQNKGYLFVRLRINNITKVKTVHRLVAKAYLPNPKSKLQVNHINGDKTDNRLENLEWVSPKENINLYYSLNKKPSGHTKFIIDTYTGIFYNSIAELAKLYNIKYPNLLMRIKRGKSRYKYA
jgi:hypothetical protein